MYICLHGGAGVHQEPSEKNLAKMLKHNSGSLVDAVMTIENDPLFNCGLGSNLNIAGKVECEAAYMNSKHMAFGGVACVSNCQNPVFVAKRLAEGYMSDPREWRLVPPMNRHNEILQRLKICWNNARAHPWIPQEAFRYRGTAAVRCSIYSLEQVLMVIRDPSFKACSTSGGLILKAEGRVGHSVQFGSAIWAEQRGNKAISVSLSGCGEALTRTSLAENLANIFFTHDEQDETLLLQTINEYFHTNFLNSSRLQSFPAARKLFGGIIMVKSDSFYQLIIAHNTPDFVFAFSDGNKTMLKFVIPQRDEDLFQQVDDAYYVSSNIEDNEYIEEALQLFQSHVNNRGFEKLPEYFDEFFAVARHNDRIGMDCKLRTFEALITGLRNLTADLRGHVSYVMNTPVLTEELTQLNFKYANCLLMYVYLLSRISYHVEAYVSKKTRLLTHDQKGRKAASESNDDYTVTFWKSQDGRLRLLRTFYELITLVAVSDGEYTVHAGIKFLWTPNFVDPQLITCILNTLMKILENPETSKASGKNILVGAFMVIRVMCIGWEQNKAVAKHLMDLSLKLEALQKPGATSFHFIDAILLVQRNDDLAPLLAAMISYLGGIDAQSFGTSETSSRPISLFITNLSEKKPHVLFKHIAHVVSFLSFDVPTLRNAILTAFADIASNCFDGSVEITDILEKQRRTMLLRLQDHITDSSALVRTKVLHVWAKLAFNRSIPVEQFRLQLLFDVRSRLKDHSVMVRKAAVGLLTMILMHNCFDSNLSYSRAYKRLNKKKEELMELRNKNPEYDMIRSAGQDFDENVVGDIRSVLEAALESYVLSDTLPTLESLSRNLRISLRRLSIVDRHDEVVDDSLENLSNEATNENNHDGIPQTYKIASRIMDKSTRLEGCVEYLRMYMEGNPFHFARDMDVTDMVSRLCKMIRDLVLLQTIASEDRNDQQLVIEEDRIEEYQNRLAELEKSMETELDKLLFIKEYEQSLLDAVCCVKRYQGVPELTDMVTYICECCKFKIRGSQEALKKAKVISRHGISNKTLDVFWEHSAEGDIETRLVAIRLIGVVAKAHKKLVQEHMGRLINLYRTKSESIRLEVLKIIANLSSGSQFDVKKMRPSEITFRIPSSDKLIKSMLAFLVTELISDQSELWIPHCRQAVNVIYGISARPCKVISLVFNRLALTVKRNLLQHNALLKKLTESLSKRDDLRNRLTIEGENESVLQDNIRLHKVKIKGTQRLIATVKARLEVGITRLLYFVGEVALKFLTYLEISFTKEIKTALQTIHDIRQISSESGQLQGFTRFAEGKDTPLVQFEKDCIRQKGFFEKADREDERIGLTAISEEEKLQIKLQQILDRDTFNNTTLNGRILPFVITILKSHVYFGENVKESAVECLAKLMLVNRKCCKTFLPLFFAFYESNASVRARNNMIILMTDLCFRFPNVFNSFNDEFIKKIRDENSGIRYTCLLVMSHMLLNDLIKVSGRIADLAPCLCDADHQIILLARGFFTEMSKKHNVLYNLMPDIISKLTTNKDLTDEQFQNVMKFLLLFIEKEHHRESLIDKLCQRFQLIKNHRVEGIVLPDSSKYLVTKLSFCIANISMNERCFRRLVENMRCYEEFLRIPQVFKHLTSALSKFKKESSKSPEIKAQIEEFEDQMQAAHKKGLDEDSIAGRAEAVNSDD
ncbi:non-SMC mitotic condensation complex subunit 1 domain-containing protein [Ditylenchus destructor]|uniref:Non-SMC mitotic condensation complex subunit 1 domain-containing protein n=1 Tax=Ditylenchus destructor TaxID=166010 RepID=A0AAD4N3B1_9BILA|nr:non-SMC mitotic condensation complex subunit 1 domain-containing protein [Ditylenchus destructor]